jgi:type I restriction enzyme, S subunit
MTTYTGRDFWERHSTRWPVAPLRALARLGTGHTPSRSHAEYWENCTIPWVTTEDLTSRSDSGLAPLMDTRQKVSEIGLANSAAVLHPTNTVMLSRTASIGHSVRIGRPMATTQAFVTWTCGPLLDPRYLLLVFKAMAPEFDRLAYGSTHLTIYFPDIEQLRVPVPPLPMQWAIADFLDAETARIDALIAKKRRMMEVVDDWEQAEGLATLGDFRTGPTKTLRQYGVGVLTGPFGTVLSAAEYVDGGVPLINPTHIRRGRLEPELGVSVPQGVADRIKRHKLRPDDVVMGRKGDVGRCAIVPPSAAGWICGSDSIAIRCNREGLRPEYIAGILQLDLYRQQLQRNSTGAMVASVNEGTLLGLRLLDVPPTQQADAVERWNGVIRRRDRLVERLDRQIDLLLEHRQALLTAAVTGDLEVPGVAA